MARETCPAMLMIASPPPPDSASSVTGVCRLSCHRPATFALSRTFVHAVFGFEAGDGGLSGWSFPAGKTYNSGLHSPNRCGGGKQGERACKSPDLAGRHMINHMTSKHGIVHLSGAEESTLCGRQRGGLSAADQVVDGDATITCVGCFNRLHYFQLWKHVNETLECVRADHGLPAALSLLERQQFDKGFIQDDLKSVQRYRLSHPIDRSRYYGIQFNPKRALRHLGAGRSVPPPGETNLNGGCYLCPENVRWQQRGIEVGYDIKVNDSEYVAWMNPFPILPTHTTIAARNHQAQSWIRTSATQSDERIRSVLKDLLKLASELPGFMGFYNGDGAGATIPGHFHFQFLRRREGQEPFALERAAARGMGNRIHHEHGSDSFIIRDYPITAVYFSGTDEYVIRGAVSWVQRWAEFYKESMALSANIICCVDEEEPNRYHLYFVPRNKQVSHSIGMSGLVGGLEVLGELVFCTDADKENLQRMTFADVERVINGVEAPGVSEFLDTVMTTASVPG